MSQSLKPLLHITLHMNSLAFSRVGIIHGTSGSGATHWQRWLECKCIQSGVETLFPKLPGRFGDPKLSAWLEALSRELPVIDRTTALIAHSMGCATVLQLLQSDSIHEVGLVVLVSPSSPSRIPRQLSHFYDGFDPVLVAMKILRSAVFASDNDVLVNPDTAATLARDLHGSFNLISGGGHLSVSSGFHKFPEVLRLLESRS